MRETVIANERRYAGRILNLRLDTVRLPTGQTMVREVVEHGEAVAIVPVDGEGHVYLVRQHRVGSHGPLIEIPAGYSTEFMYFYLATELRESRLEQDFDEAIEVEKVSLGEAIRRLAGGNEPTDVKTITGLMLARERLGIRD